MRIHLLKNLTAWALCLGWAICAESGLESGVFGVSGAQALILAKEGKFHEALMNEEKVYKSAQDRFGPAHPALVPILDNLASLHRYLADYGNAEEELNWSLALLERSLGPEDPVVADAQEQLASLYVDLGRFQEAQILEKKALSIRGDLTPSEPEALTRTLDSLGRIETSLHEWPSAQSYFEKGLALREQNHKDGDALTFRLLTGLADIFRLEGDHLKAEAALQKVLAAAQKNFPSKDIQVSDALENLADFYHSQKMDTKAQPLYVSALEIDKSFVGTYTGYSTLPYMKRLAKDDQGAGDLAGAKKWLEKSLKTEKEVFGPQHPRVALGLIRLAGAESALGKKDLAKADLEKAISILSSFFKDGHPLLDEARTSLENLSK